MNDDELEGDIMDTALEEFPDYEKYLDAHMSDEDLFYLEDKELARQLIEVGYHGKGEILTRDQFLKRKAAIAEAKKNKEETTGSWAGRLSCISKCGGPSGPAKENLPPNLLDHRTKDYFDLQITPKFVEYITEASNRRAVAEGASSKTYADWVPFDQKEIYKFFCLLFANALFAKASDYLLVPVFDKQ